MQIDYDLLTVQTVLLPKVQTDQIFNIRNQFDLDCKFFGTKCIFSLIFFSLAENIHAFVHKTMK